MADGHVQGGLLTFDPGLRKETDPSVEFPRNTRPFP